MNAIGYAPPTFPRQPRRKFHRVETVTLASSVSIVALLVSTALYAFAGVGETPLVVGTIVGASIAGWVNAYLPAGAAPDGGFEPALGRDPEWDQYDDQEWFGRAA